MRRTDTFITRDKKKKQSTLILQRTIGSDDDVFVNSNPYMHLDVLAWKYLGNARLWWVIARTNNLNSIIPPQDGRILRIPVGGRVSYYKE
jgi:hypothetical protein